MQQADMRVGAFDDLVATLRALGVSAVRVGGTYAQGVLWRDWRGDAALRPRSPARDGGVAAPADTHALATSKVRPAHIAALVNLVDAGTVLTNAAKEIFIEMAATGDQPDAIAEQRGLRAAPIDTNELETWCRDSIAANPKAVAEFKSGKDSAINALKGPVMKAAKGKANPKLVDETLRRLLAVM